MAISACVQVHKCHILSPVGATFLKFYTLECADEDQLNVNMYIYYIVGHLDF